MAMNTGVSIVRADGEGEKMWFYGGGVHTWKATNEETGGVFLLFEDMMSKGKVTPLHLHPDVDETLYMLEGEILVYLDGHEQLIGQHGVVVAPRGVPHAFLVISETARMLCLETPGLSEAFYRGASEPATDDLVAAAPVDFARIAASAERYGGIVILGPPPFQTA